MEEDDLTAAVKSRSSHESFLGFLEFVEAPAAHR